MVTPSQMYCLGGDDWGEARTTGKRKRSARRNVSIVTAASEVGPDEDTTCPLLLLPASTPRSRRRLDEEIARVISVLEQGRALVGRNPARAEEVLRHVWTSTTMVDLAAQCTRSAGRPTLESWQAAVSEARSAQVLAHLPVPGLASLVVTYQQQPQPQPGAPLADSTTGEPYWPRAQTLQSAWDPRKALPMPSQVLCVVDSAVYALQDEQNVMRYRAGAAEPELFVRWKSRVDSLRMCAASRTVFLVTSLRVVCVIDCRAQEWRVLMKFGNEKLLAVTATEEYAYAVWGALKLQGSTHATLRVVHIATARLAAVFRIALNPYHGHVRLACDGDTLRVVHDASLTVLTAHPPFLELEDTP